MMSGALTARPRFKGQKNLTPTRHLTGYMKDEGESRGDERLRGDWKKQNIGALCSRDTYPELHITGYT